MSSNGNLQAQNSQVRTDKNYVIITLKYKVLQLRVTNEVNSIQLKHPVQCGHVLSIVKQQPVRGS